MWVRAGFGEKRKVRSREELQAPALKRSDAKALLPQVQIWTG